MKASTSRIGALGAFFFSLTIMLGAANQTLHAQEMDSSTKHKKQAGQAPEGKPDRAPGGTTPEQRFKDVMTDAVLSGTWQMTMGDGISKPVTLSDPQPESYTISRVEQTAGDFWVITARIKYADKDVELPILVRVVWSGDTPIITVDNLAVPMIGTYSARVMIYKGFYAGTWFGTGYGGVLSGKVTKASRLPNPKPKAAPKPKP